MAAVPWLWNKVYDAQLTMSQKDGSESVDTISNISKLKIVVL
jgi:hypothetical protein